MTPLEEMQLQAERAEQSADAQQKLAYLVRARDLLDEILEGDASPIASKATDLYGLYFQRCLRQLTTGRAINAETFHGFIKLGLPISSFRGRIHAQDPEVMDAMQAFLDRYKGFIR